ncbi:MAG: hypothetical protein ACKO57_03015 [Alphaproteobacteria bacterium]
MFAIPPPVPALVVPVSAIKGSIPAKSDKATYREAVQRKTRKDAPPWRDDTFQVSDQESGRGHEIDSLF